MYSTGNTACAKAGRTGTGGRCARLCGKPGPAAGRQHAAGRQGAAASVGLLGGSLPRAWLGAAGDARPCSSSPTSPQSRIPRTCGGASALWLSCWASTEVVRDRNSRNMGQSPAFS